MKFSKQFSASLAIAMALIGFNACDDAKEALGKPVISNIEPENGSEDGGTLVTITGENLDEDASIEIGGVDCAFETFTSNNKISCITGEKNVSSDTSYDVKVTNPDGDSDTLEDAFTYENED